MDASEAGAGVGCDIFEAQGLDDVHHKVRSRAVRGPNVDARRRRSGFGRGLLGAGKGIRGSRAMNFRRFLCLCGLGFRDQCGGSAGCSSRGALQEAATVN